MPLSVRGATMEVPEQGGAVNGPTITQLIAGVNAALEKVAEGMAALGQAADALEEAVQASSQSLAGGTDWDEVVPPFQDARDRVLDNLRRCGEVTKLGEKIIAGLGGRAAPSGSPPRTATPASRNRPAAQQSYPVDPDWSTRARARLPVRVNDTGPTHGEYVDADGIPHTVRSGAEEDGLHTELDAFLIEQRLIPAKWGSVATSTHVELKVAYRMRKSGTRHLTLAINNTVDKALYGCHRLLEWVLPTGYTLEIHDDQGKHTYRGKGGVDQ